MSFSNLGLNAELLRAISDLGFTQPTPIQRSAVPPALEGRDVLACAMTGSGKTAAFLLPMLQSLRERSRGGPRALVLAPTRELAAQIAESFTELSKYVRLSATAIYGGVSIVPQERDLRRGVDVVIATPGRLLDHLDRGNLRFDDLEILVLDEADRMLDMGFLPDIKRVLRQLPPRRQNLLFSATIPAPIARLSKELLHDPATIDVQRASKPATGITQAIYPVPEKLKRALLLHLLKRDGIGNALVFTRTKHRANRLAQHLQRHDISCERIHGNRSQKQRTEALAGFKAGNIRVLVATDIAARGIDVEALSHVINFDVPNVPEDYIHRVGRTARAAATGDAFTFVSADDESNLRAIERAVGHRLNRLKVEGFDYDAKADEPLEIPLKDRIAAIRARKAEERARAKEKAARKEARAGGEAARPQRSKRGGGPAKRGASGSRAQGQGPAQGQGKGQGQGPAKSQSQGQSSQGQRPASPKPPRRARRTARTTWSS